MAKNQGRLKRRKRIRAKIFGTAERPRFSVFKSNKHFYIQLIDDDSGKTLVSAADTELAAFGKKSEKKNNVKTVAGELGKYLAKKAIKAGIKKAVFDRGGYKFHGAILQIANGAREEGLNF